MKATDSLSRLEQTSFSLLKAPVPVSREAEPVKKQMQLLTELTFIYILKLLGVEDEKKLAEIVSRLREGTPFYHFTFLAHNLAKSKTDFDFLTSPENLSAYAKIAEVSRECGIVLLPYVNVLGRIAENKQYGLYSENQEVGFFLDEYHKYKDTVGASEFLHQFKKILKYETQNLFERFIKDGIFSLIQATLRDNSEKIASEQTLAIYVYGLHYYVPSISNADENFLHEHIRFCVNYLSSHGEITFKPIAVRKKILNFENEKAALNYFFAHNSQTLDSLERFCGLLEDVCPSEEAIEFCEFLRENLHKANGKFFDDGASKFNQIMARTLREKVKLENIPLYREMCKLFPQKIIGARSPSVQGVWYQFYDENGNFLFHVNATGNRNQKVPEAHVFVELEILKQREKGSVETWNWREISSQHKFPGMKS